MRWILPSALLTNWPPISRYRCWPCSPRAKSKADVSPLLRIYRGSVWRHSRSALLVPQPDSSRGAGIAELCFFLEPWLHRSDRAAGDGKDDATVRVSGPDPGASSHRAFVQFSDGSDRSVAESPARK